MNRLRKNLRYLFVTTLIGSFVAMPAMAAPNIVSPAIAVVNNPVTPSSAPTFVAVAVTGSGFGSPTIAGRLRVRDVVTGGTRNIAANDSSKIVFWNDNRIVAKLPEGFTHPQVWVERNDTNTTSAIVTAHRYEYRYYVTAGVGLGTNPTALGGTAGDVWILDEFHTALKNFAGNSVQPVPVTSSQVASGLPQCIDNSCFAAVTTSAGDTNWPSSHLGEAVVTDSYGRIWFTQGGEEVYGGPNYNHSRVVSYDPATDLYTAYKLPGDNLAIRGLAWQPAPRNRLWVAADRQRANGATVPFSPTRLLSFNPDQIAAEISDNSLSFTTAAAAAEAACIGSGGPLSNQHGVCSGAPDRGCMTSHDCVLTEHICSGIYASDSTDGGCFREYDLSDSPINSGARSLGQMYFGPDGALWYAGWQGSDSPDRNNDLFADGDGRVYLGRFNPATGEDRHYPAYYTTQADPLGLWDVSRTLNGDILATGYTSHALFRLDGSRVNDPACQNLVSSTTNCAPNGSPNSTCQNPCITRAEPPGFIATNVQQLMHSVAADAAGNAWFSQGGFVADLRYSSSFGYWKADFGGMVLFPSPSLYLDQISTSQIGSCLKNSPEFAPLGLRAFSGADILVSNSGDGETVNVADWCTKTLWRVRRLPDI